VAWVRDRTIPTERPPLVGQVSAKFADKGCHVVSVTDPYGRNLGFLDRSRYFLPSSSSVVLTRLSGPKERYCEGRMNRARLIISYVSTVQVYNCIEYRISWKADSRSFSQEISLFYGFQILLSYYPNRPPLWSSGQSSWLHIRRPGFDSRHYQIWEVVGLERGPLSLVSTTEELLDRKVAAPV
jgi:hypothetical protein